MKKLLLLTVAVATLAGCEQPYEEDFMPQNTESQTRAGWNDLTPADPIVVMPMLPTAAQLNSWAVEVLNVGNNELVLDAILQENRMPSPDPYVRPTGAINILRDVNFNTIPTTIALEQMYVIDGNQVWAPKYNAGTIREYPYTIQRSGSGQSTLPSIDDAYVIAKVIVTKFSLVNPTPKDPLVPPVITDPNVPGSIILDPVIPSIVRETHYVKCDTVVLSISY
ncbi:MAG: membrane lipoprotein lipid attachment site-containing protein [Alistipes sp.]|jgi:hypothetical protein|nr:membrane lipoprotein lipid attachment site-containing protein [Alistipes sp.]